ncbi:ABC transporter substrate-binding protein [Flexivirga caeni]|uniref:ABC transporter substrate-binding protein n=1 Tax=Flexivirga caeni TaxID=2294115 RepID=A0A3M9MJW8_9MICO|nr:ABC transporter substrate-binding protein [Flexivirga caeni]RNI25475.1 ABC transporter substrate-binding protein [Flexivirga caeni]
MVEHVRRFHRRAVVAALPVIAVAVVAGCGSSSQSSGRSAHSGAGGNGTQAIGAKAPLFAQLPPNIQKDKTIQLGSSVDYPPFEFYKADGKTLDGFEPALASLLEKQLGVTFTWNNASFDTLFSALKSGRYDIVYGATNDTKEREQSFNFVDYLRSSQGFDVLKGNPKKIKSVDDLCGKTIAAVRGGIQAQYLASKSKDCTAHGKAPLTPMVFTGNAEEQLAVREGKADALLENYPTAVYFAQKSNGILELVPGLQVEKQYFGMVVPKSSTKLRDALMKAWQAIISDGSYRKVLMEWGLADVGLDKPLINAVAAGK